MQSIPASWTLVSILFAASAVLVATPISTATAIQLPPESALAVFSAVMKEYGPTAVLVASLIWLLRFTLTRMVKLIADVSCNLANLTAAVTALRTEMSNLRRAIEFHLPMAKEFLDELDLNDAALARRQQINQGLLKP